jgi:hypothetical protein
MSRRRSLAFEIAFAALAAFAAVPLWIVPYPPLQDLPQHLAAVRVIHDYGDATLAFAPHFEVELGRTQYLAYYLVVHLLAWPFGVETANLLVLTAAIVGTPYALRALLLAVGRDDRHALFVLPLTWNAHLILGFLNFVAAIPLMLAGLAVACRQRETPSLWRGVGLTGLLLLTFYTHVVPFALLGLGAALVLVGAPLRDAARRAWPLAPAAVAALLWAWTSPAGQSTVAAAQGDGAAGGRPGTVYAPWLRSLQEAPQWLTDVLHGPDGVKLLVGWTLLVVVALVVGMGTTPAGVPAGRVREGMARRLGLLVPLAALAYFVAPVSHDWIWPINARFPLLALVLLPLLLPPLRGARAAAVFGGVALVAVLGFVQVTRAFVDFDEEVGDLDAAIASIPEGQRVAGLVFDRSSKVVKFSPFLHAVAWYQARRGGAVMFTFADFPQSPIRFREEARPPRVRPRWEWTPERVNPRRDLGWYDYVLVRGGPGRIASQHDTYEPVHRSDRWSVWRRVGAAQGALE